MLEVVHEFGRIRLLGQATIYYAEELQQKLAAAMAHSQEPLSIDLSGLESLDMAGAQLLLALSRTYGPARVRFQACPEPIRQMLALSGIERCLLQRSES